VIAGAALAAPQIAAVPPNAANDGENPPNVDWKLVFEVTIVRNEPTAEAWLAAIRAFNKLGMAIAAMIRMIATTISSSISEKPFCLRIVFLSPPESKSRIK
jgi:hypothetical protein